MIYYVLVLFCQKTAEIYIPLSLNCKYMMNQNSSGFLSSIPMVTKNLIIINLLFWVASLVLPKVGIDLVQLFGLHFPGVKDFYPFQFVTYMFMHDTPFALAKEWTEYSQTSSCVIPAPIPVTM